MKYPTYLPTDFVKQDDKARFKSYLDGFKPLGSDYEPTKAAPDLFTEAARIAREKGYDDDAGRVVQAILRTEGALSGEVGDKDLPGGGSFGPLQFYRKYGMLPSYAKSLGVSEDDAAEHARKNPTHAIDWALGGYLGNAIREGQAKGLRGAELATYAQQHGQRSQAPERAGQNYSAMFGGGQPIPAHAPTTIGPRKTAIPAHTPVDDRAEFGKYLSSFPELGSDLQMGKERAIPAHEPRDDKQAFGEFLDSFPKLGGDLLGEAAKQLPFVGPAVQNIGKAVEPLGEAMNWYGKNVQGPQMEAIHRAGLESGASESLGEPFAVQRGMAAQPLATLLPTAVRDISESGGLPEWWRNLTETYEQRPEDFPGQKGVAELAVPSEIVANVITEPAAIGRAAKGVAEAAGKALPEAGRLGRALAGEAGEQLLERTPMRTFAGDLGKGVEDVSRKAAKEPWEMTASDIEARYPNAGAAVDGRTVGKTVKNQSSIEASIDNPTALEGIREVPISAFEDSGPPKFYSSSEEARTRQLAEQIQQSGHIDPLIVVDDAQGSPYILEGGHRFDALKILGAKSFPAQVVVDEDAYYKAAKEALVSGKPVPDEVLRDYPDLVQTPPTSVSKPADAAPTPAPIKEPLTKPPAIKGKGEKVEQGPQLPKQPPPPPEGTLRVPAVGDVIEYIEGFGELVGAKPVRRTVVRLQKDPITGQMVPIVKVGGKEWPASEWFDSGRIVGKETPGQAQEPLTKPPAIKGKGEKVEQQPKTRDAAETVAEEGAEQGVQQVQGDEGGVPRVSPVEPPTVAVEPPKGESWLPTVKSTEKVIEAAYNPDWLRRLADKLGGTPLRRLTPGLGIQDITKKGEQTLADVGQVLGMPKRDVFTEATVLRESIMADWKSGVVGATSRLRSQGDTKGLFKVDKDGLADIAGTKVPINDVLEYPARYNLSSEQRTYAETMHRLYDEQKLALAGEGIEIRELGFDAGGHYVGRRVLGKVDEQGNVEIGEIVGAGGKRIGAKMGFEKGRQFKTQAEAIKEGFRYLTPEETLQMNLEAAGRRIADKRMADYVLERIPYRTGAAPEELKLARDFAKDKLFAVAKLKAVVNRGYRGERVPTNVITSIGRFFPDQAKGLIEAGITRPENIITRAGLQQVEAAIPNLKTQSQAAYYKAQNVLTKAGEKARQPKYGEGTVQTPAFQAKFFSAEDAKKLRQILDLEKPAPLRGLAQSISYVNALPRLLLTTYDIGTPLIHGQIALFSHPIVWGKATGRMAQALVSEKGYQTFLKTHADTIQKWSQDGAIFTSSEFTEAAQPGRLTSKIPGIKQFGRGFEGLLNASRIYGLEATEHMAKTQQDRADLAKFWNEMSGVVNTARMGISPTQRELETAILFAPRYRRAMLTLMTDIAKGGLRGQMARDAVGRATVAGLLGYVGVAYALGQQPHLDPREGGKFLTVEIAGQNVGLGGAFYSTSRTLLQMALEPEKAPEIATKYVQYSLSPTVGTAIDIYQKPYLYQGALKLTERVLAENLTPFWTQAMLLDEQEGSEAAAATAMEFAGLRTFPVKEDLTGLTPFQKKLRQTDKSGLTPFQKRLQGAESGGLTPFQKRLQGNSQEGVTPFQKRLGVGAR